MSGYKAKAIEPRVAFEVWNTCSVILWLRSGPYVVIVAPLTCLRSGPYVVIVAVRLTCLPCDFSKTPWLYGGEESVPCVSCASSSAAVATRNALGVVFPSAGHEHFRGRQGVLTPFLPSKHVVLELV